MSSVSCCNTKQCDVDQAVIFDVSSTLNMEDLLGSWKVRWGIGRMNYTVKPGLYRLNNPDTLSPVLVSANYKLTFDGLRKNLAKLPCWILILDTQGINVWCAAGKRTFGTDELIYRIEVTKLGNYVDHRQLILPQLGASGVCAYDVKEKTAFTVLFGPVYAKDIPEYITAHYQASPKQRIVQFTFYDRLVLTPVEIMSGLKMILPVGGIFFILNQFTQRQFTLADLVLFLVAVLTGSFLTPLLLPYIPGKAFSWKGWFLGLLGTIITLCLSCCDIWEEACMVIGYGFLLPALSAYLALNFTGSSTYTSPSGVFKEMKIALPFIVGFGILGLILVFIGSFRG